MPAHAKQASTPLVEKMFEMSLLFTKVCNSVSTVAAENGEFSVRWGINRARKFATEKVDFVVGDILIEVNEQTVVGLTLQDLMNRINKAGKKIYFKVVQPGMGCAVFLYA